MKRFLRVFCFILIVSLLLSTPVDAAYENGYVGGMAGSDAGILAHGLDLSEWQGENVDFARIREQGYEFVILRAGFSTTRDAYFESNYARAREAGLNIGVYLYSYAATAQEAVKEAEACAQWLNGKRLEYPVYFDLEDPSVHAEMSREKLTELALAFLDTLSAKGWLCGLYSCKSWLSDKLDTETLGARYECWMAQYLYDGTYDIYEQYDGVYGIWQYSCSGVVDGVDGLVDKNVAFKDYPAICRRYGFNGYSAQTEPVTLHAEAAPTALPLGQPYPVSGTLTFSHTASAAVTVGLYDAAGALCAGKTVRVSEARAELSVLIGQISTAGLEAGRYYYRVTAENHEGAFRLANLSVALSASGARLDAASAPENLTVDTNFSIGGHITSASALESVTVGIFNTAGTAKIERTDMPKTTEYDLSSFRNALPFSTLETGDYEYRVTVKTARATEILLSKSFSVWGKDDPITLSGLQLRAGYLRGELRALEGTVTSSHSDLKRVTVRVENIVGTVVINEQTENAGKSLSLDTLALPLRELSAGSYCCYVTAVNAAGPTELFRQTFTIEPDAIDLYDAVLPTFLRKGESFCLGGLLASQSGVLRAVSVTVTSETGTVCLNAAYTTKEKTFALDRFNTRLSFSSLSAGTYDLCIRAENESGSSTVYNSSLYVRAESDWVDWKGTFFRPDGRTYRIGESPDIGGVLVSESNISEVVVEINNAEGRVVMDARLYPDAAQVSLAAMNKRLKFAALPVGSYRYRVTAVNASGEFTLLNDRFSYADCPHSNLQTAQRLSASCTQCGVSAAVYCQDCGGKVRDGLTRERSTHVFTDGVCTVCGSREAVPVLVRRCTQQPTAGKQYILGYTDSLRSYALSPSGEAVLLNVAMDGTFEVAAGLLWTAESRMYKNKTGMALVDRDGRSLHLDSDALRVCIGGANTLLTFTPSGSGFFVAAAGDDERAIGFSAGKFEIGRTELFLWETVYEISGTFSE